MHCALEITAQKVTCKTSFKDPNPWAMQIPTIFSSAHGQLTYCMTYMYMPLKYHTATINAIFSYTETCTHTTLANKVKSTLGRCMALVSSHPFGKTHHKCMRPGFPGNRWQQTAPLVASWTISPANGTGSPSESRRGFS